jgi:multiple sugar transport system permease protein
MNTTAVPGSATAPDSTIATPRRRIQFGRLTWRVILHVVLYAGAAIFLIPLFWMLSTSLKTLQETYADPPLLWPHVPQLQNFKTAWTQLPFTLYTYHTLFITVTSMVPGISAATLCAYGFARIQFWGRNILFLCVIASVMLPFTVTVLPLYIIFRDLGWLNTLKPLIIPTWFGGGAFNIFLLRQFFQTIPRELDEAARIDGCSTFGILWRILVPQIKPALAVVAILWFQNTWTDLLGPVIYLNTSNMYTLAIGVYSFAATNASVTVNHEEWLMAVAFAMVLPVAVIFLVAQRYMIRGVVLSGIKG